MLGILCDKILLKIFLPDFYDLHKVDLQNNYAIELFLKPFKELAERVLNPTKHSWSLYILLIKRPSLCSFQYPLRFSELHTTAPILEL